MNGAGSAPAATGGSTTQYGSAPSPAPPNRIGLVLLPSGLFCCVAPVLYTAADSGWFWLTGGPLSGIGAGPCEFGQ